VSLTVQRSGEVPAVREIHIIAEREEALRHGGTTCCGLMQSHGDPVVPQDVPPFRNRRDFSWQEPPKVPKGSIGFTSPWCLPPVSSASWNCLQPAVCTTSTVGDAPGLVETWRAAFLTPVHSETRAFVLWPTPCCGACRGD
jgi:hypothetical protein